ncbi:hypothetical protein [Flavobacterium sp.]|uniref:hypothetical protein n=1 Tax=Flavobacterium sp. TaxID=239 RepID=UPI0025B857D9|nr:hypothetical protein [Flavobacterium sp.]
MIIITNIISKKYKNHVYKKRFDSSTKPLFNKNTRKEKNIFPFLCQRDKLNTKAMNHDTKELFNYLNQSIANNATYRELSNLCLTLFCTCSILPERFETTIINKEKLAKIFSKIAKEKNIVSYPPTASFYGASFHNTHNKGHWLEVMASVLKLAREPNIKEAKNLLA